MKNFAITILTILLLVGSITAHAQNRSRFEIGISGGGPDYMLGVVGGAETDFAMMGEIKFTPIKWISIGLIGGIHDRRPGHDYYSSEESDPKASTTYNCNMMMMLYGNWFTRERFKIYSGIGYGTMAGYVNGDGRQSHGIQITPLGVSFGKHLFGFAELGMGWMFCPARAGIGYRF